MLNSHILINIIWLSLSFADHDSALHQKMVLALSQDLFIKNIVLFKHTSIFIDSKTILFAKKLSHSNIYSSFLSAKEIELKMDNRVYLKSLIVTFEEKFNDKVYEIISKNEMESSKFLWLVWSKKNEEGIKNGIYIPYNCQMFIAKDENIFTISEMYHPRVNSSTVFKRHFGVWSENKGFEVFERDLYKRRFNMNGTELKVLFIKDELIPSPWLEIIKKISAAMNFRLVPIFVNDYMEDKKITSWEIHSGLRVFDHTMAPQTQVLGLTYKISVFMYIRYEQLLDHRETYIRPFSKELWHAILILIAFSGLFTFSLIYLKAKTGISNQDFLSAFFHPLEAFSNQCGNEEFQDRSTRITVLTIRFTALFIVPAYSAFILTFILYPNVKLPFRDMRGFVQDGSYKIAFAKEENWDSWFQVTQDYWSKLAYEKHLLESDKMPANQDEVDEKICYETKKIAFLIIEQDVFFILCKIVKVPTRIMTGWYGFELREKSPYKIIFNRILKIFHYSGLFNRNDKRRKSLKLLLPNFDDTNEQKPVKIVSIIPIIKLITILYLTAVVILFFENLYKISAYIIKIF